LNPLNPLHPLENKGLPTTFYERIFEKIKLVFLYPIQEELSLRVKPAMTRYNPNRVLKPC